MTIQEQINTDIKEKRKCYHFNRGYCKLKDQCFYHHPTVDCRIKCKVITCKYRHRNACKYGDNCYHHKSQTCEYLHESNNLPEVTLACEDEDQSKNHKVILTAPSTNNDEANTNTELQVKIECLKMEIKDGKEREIIYKKEIAEQNEKEIEYKRQIDNQIECLKMEIKEGKEREMRYKKEIAEQNEKEIEYKREIYNQKVKNMDINLYKIENEKLNKEINDIKEKDIEKEAEHNNKINELRKRIKNISLEKIYQSKHKENGQEEQINEKDMETQPIKEYNCKDCDFKTNWMTNLKTHKNKCKKTKKRNK